MKNQIDFKKLRPARFSEQAYRAAEATVARVENGAGFQELTACPICETALHHIEMVKCSVPIFDCDHCGVSLAGSHPKDFNDVYSTDEYLEDTLSAYDKTREYRKKRFGTERLAILERYKRNGKLLDVGCGSGWFLEIARQKFQVAGVEFSDSIRQWLNESLGIPSVKSMDDLDEKFDVITAFDLIEHVPDPVGTLNKMHGLLKDDGIILIYTPNKKSLAFQITGEHNNLICPPQHLYYFDFNSFQFTSDKAGFEIIFFETRGTDVGDIASYYECWESNKKLAFENAGINQDFIDQINFANHGRFILKKKS